METKLVLRRPVVVLLGAWNPAIFTPEWIAHFLFEYKDGDNVTIGMIQEVASGEHIIFIDNIGISASTNRLKFFVWEENDIEKLPSVITKLYETLPHTPLGDFGVNYKFTVESPNISIVESLETSEFLDMEFAILRQEIKTQLGRDESSVINLQRIFDGNDFELDLNFHFSVTNAGEILELVNAGICATCLAEAKKLIEKIYGISESTCEGFELDQPVKGAERQ